MCLSSGAYAVYQQQNEENKSDFTCIKNALYMAFALDSVTAWKQFIAHRLCLSETVDVFVTELCKLIVLVGDITDQSLMGAFIADLPEHAEELLQAFSKLDDMDISQILARVRVILKKRPANNEQEVVVAWPLHYQAKDVDTPTKFYGVWQAQSPGTQLTLAE